MPCRAVKARKLLDTGKAWAKWDKLGNFYTLIGFNRITQKAKVNECEVLTTRTFYNEGV